jgi:hypothetical protein
LRRDWRRGGTYRRFGNTLHTKGKGEEEGQRRLLRRLFVLLGMFVFFQRFVKARKKQKGKLISLTNT